MSEKEREKKNPKEEAEEVKEILGAVSTQVPALIKSVLASVFSEEAGRSMGKAAAAYYKELKDSGMPENVAVKMTEDYMKTFTNIGNVFQNIGRHDRQAGVGDRVSQNVGDEIERRVREKIDSKRREQEDKEEEE